jgi:hypothetical protein
MTKAQALQHISVIADDSGSFRTPAGLPCDDIPTNAVLVAWDDAAVGKPLVVAVKSYLPGVTLDREVAIELAIDGLVERNWFSGQARNPDYIF